MLLQYLTPQIDEKETKRFFPSEIESKHAKIMTMILTFQHKKRLRKTITVTLKTTLIKGTKSFGLKVTAKFTSLFCVVFVLMQFVIIRFLVNAKCKTVSANVINKILR